VIRFRADAVFTILDGFSGKTVTPSSLRVFLDGEPYKPQYKEGGLLVFIDLEPGEREITIKSSVYLDETISIITTGDRLEERTISLKPAENYPFGKNAAHARATVRQNGACVKGADVKLAVIYGTEIKIAQDSLASGETKMRLFIKGEHALKLPMEYLITDGQQYEINTLISLIDGIGILLDPLENNYIRGDALYPCQSYKTDENVIINVTVQEPSTVYAHVENKLFTFKLAPGENNLEMDI
jgi:hypothetical protein